MYKKDKLKNLTNDELEKLLDEADWYDRELVKEYDKRKRDGRIKFIPIGNIEEHFRKRRESKNQKAS